MTILHLYLQKKIATSHITTVNCSSYPDSPLIRSRVTHEGVSRLLSNLHLNKATGLDKLPSSIDS